MPAPAPAAIRLGVPHPYLKTHGTKVARLHMLDWIVLVLLAVIDGVLNLIEPFHRFVGEDMMATLRYPMKDNTVPRLGRADLFHGSNWTQLLVVTQILAVVGPMIIIAGIYMRRRNAYDLHHAILGLLFSVLITGVPTDAIKDGVGRPRPNFFWRCFPDGVPNYNNITRQVICHGDARHQRRAQELPKWSHFMVIRRTRLPVMVPGREDQAFDRGGHVAKLCIVLLPLLLAAGSRGLTTTGTTGRMCSPVDFLDWWLLRFATCSSSHLPLVNKDCGLMRTFITFLTLKPRTKCSQQLPRITIKSLSHDSSLGPVAMEMRTTSQALDSMEASSRAR